MGIVNANDDSFSFDGSLEEETLVALIRRQIAQGADVIDIGAESARTNRAAIGGGGVAAVPFGDGDVAGDLASL